MSRNRPLRLIDDSFDHIITSFLVLQSCISGRKLFIGHYLFLVESVDIPAEAAFGGINYNVVESS